MEVGEMPNETEPKGWWHTLPGILTSTAAVLTAITGLIVAVRTIDQARTPANTPTSAQSAPAPVPERPSAADQASTQPPNEHNQDRLPTSVAQPPTSALPAEGVSAGISVTGTWRDNFGNLTKYIQNGPSIRFEAYGKSCNGSYFQSSGSGNISGNQIRSTYQSTMRSTGSSSTGSCVSYIDEFGASISSTCTDSMCGTFETLATKLQ